MARVIGQAAIRLVVDGAGLGDTMRREIKKAAREGLSGDLFKDAEDDADKTATKVGGTFSKLFGKLTGLAGSFGSVLAGGAKIATIGAAAGAAVAGVTSLASGLAGLVVAAGQAAGVIGLLPAAFAGLVAVQATIKLGTKGVGDAFSALADGDAKKLAESLKKLAPSAQEFVLAAKGIKPEFDKMQLGVQQTLFEGLGTQLKTIGEKYLPIAKTLFGNLAGTINEAAKEAGGFITSSGPLTQISETIVPNLSAAFQNLVPAIKPIIDAILNFVTVGSNFLPQLTTGIANGAKAFGAFINGAADSGALETFFQTAIDTAKQFGRILGDVGSILSSVFSAATSSGGGLLNNIEQITTALSTFLNSTAGQTALTSFFGAVRDVISAVLPLFLQLAQIIGTTLFPILAQLAVSLATGLQPVIAALGPALQAAAPGIKALGDGFALFLAAMAPALPAIGQLIGVLGQGLGTVLGALGPVLSQFAQVFATTLASAIPPLIPIITQLVQIIGQILTAVTPLITPLVQLAAAALGPILTIVQALIPPFQNLINNVIKALEPAIPPIADAFTALGEALGPLAGALGDAFVQILTALLPLIEPLARLFSSLVQALTPLIDPITALLPIITDLISLLVTIGVTVLSLIIDAITPLIDAFGAIVTVVSGVVTTVIDVIGGFVDGITTAFTSILETVTGVWNNISSFLSDRIQGISSFFSDGFARVRNTVSDAFNAIKTSVSDGIGNVVQFFRDLPGKILSAISNFGSLLLQSGRDLLQGLVNGITGAVRGVIDAVVNVGKGILNGIKGALGISSPSKEMAKIGVFVAQGLQQGIEKGSPAVLNTANALANSVLDTMNKPITSGLSVPGNGQAGTATQTPAGSNSLVQNNYMLPGTNVDQFANTVLRRANTDLLSGASSLPVMRQGVQQGVNDNFLAGVSS